MSVLAMLAVLWWALCGFLAVAVGVWGFISVLGPKGRLVLVLLVGTLGGHLLDRYLHADERCAGDFLTAWQAESADFPDGRINSRTACEFLDYDRLGGTYDPSFPLQFRLLYHSPVRPAGKEEVDTKGSAAPVSAKVFVADARLHGSEQDVDCRAKIRVWVATDSDKVVKFMFENIVFL